jgi:hypothetical protein
MIFQLSALIKVDKGYFICRYDWLPNMFVGFGSKATPVVFAGPGCDRHPLVRHKIALLTDGACSYYKKVFS